MLWKIITNVWHRCRVPSLHLQTSCRSAIRSWRLPKKRTKARTALTAHFGAAPDSFFTHVVTGLIGKWTVTTPSSPTMRPGRSWTTTSRRPVATSIWDSCSTRTPTVSPSSGYYDLTKVISKLLIIIPADWICLSPLNSFIMRQIWTWCFLSLQQ